MDYLATVASYPKPDEKIRTEDYMVRILIYLRDLVQAYYLKVAN